MPYRPSLRSIWTLIFLAVICYGLYAWCENSRVQHKLPFYTEKITAAKLMDRALKTYESAGLVSGVVSSEYSDPRLDAIIGQQFTLITTEFGTFESKLAGANPNFAALIVQLLTDAGVRPGGRVAVSFTGSDPGVNTAVLCACEALKVIPVTISSVASTWWGANDPDFTWLDMERLINREGITRSKPVAASMGGINDHAVGLSQVGQDLIADAATRNRLPLIQDSTIGAAVEHRLALYREAHAEMYDAYVNVGEDVVSLGHPMNDRLIPDGVHKRLPQQNYPSLGVIHKMNRDRVPVINITEPALMSESYGLGGAQVPLPDIGVGRVYIEERYDMRVAGVSAVLALILIVVLVRLDARLFKLRDTGVDPDTLM